MSILLYRYRHFIIKKSIFHHFKRSCTNLTSNYLNPKSHIIFSFMCSHRFPFSSLIVRSADANNNKTPNNKRPALASFNPSFVIIIISFIIVIVLRLYRIVPWTACMASRSPLPHHRYPYVCRRTELCLSVSYASRQYILVNLSLFCLYLLETVHNSRNLKFQSAGFCWLSFLPNYRIKDLHSRLLPTC